MAHFRGTVSGNRGEASRLGTKGSGITAKANGWNLGVTVFGYEDPKTNEDTFEIHLTSGSSCKGDHKIIGTFTAKDLED